MTTYINRCIYDKKPIIFPIENEMSVLIGENGTGKSLLLRELSAYFLDQNQPVVFLQDERIFDLTEGEALRIMYKEKLKNKDNLFDKYKINIDLLKLASQEGKFIHSGYMQLVYILCKALSAAKGSVLIIDEPERHLSLEFQETLLLDLIALTQIKKVIVATHAPSMLMDFSACIHIEDCFLNVEEKV